MTYWQEKASSPVGIVLTWSDWTHSRASRNSFQQLRAEKIATVASPAPAGEHLVEGPLEVRLRQARHERLRHPGGLHGHRLPAAEAQPREAEDGVADVDPQLRRDGVVRVHGAERQQPAADVVHGDEPAELPDQLAVHGGDAWPVHALSTDGRRRVAQPRG